jgi:hypothetical protein
MSSPFGSPEKEAKLNIQRKSKVVKNISLEVNHSISSEIESINLR